jgi:DNA-binding CsgD family transcriptional regulator
LRTRRAGSYVAHGMMLGRSTERAEIDELLAGARAGRSSALVICGDPGIGKTTLLEYAVSQAREVHDMQVLSARGYETESEIPFAGLADLVRPVLALLPSLPESQRAALQSALALGPPLAGDRFSICAATVAVLAAAAEQSPTLVVVDDLHWLDAASTEAVLFAGHRLQADGIALLLATRPSDDGEDPDLRLRELRLTGLSRGEADELCRALIPSAPDDVRARLYDASNGNPLGVIELAEAWKTHHLDGAAAAPLVQPGSRIERALRARLAGLPERTRHVLLLAAAASGDDTGVVLLAARLSGLELADFAPAEAAHLVVIDDRRIEIRHPLLRSVLYHSASTDARCQVHAALAAALADVPGTAAADARAWHLAAATFAPDEQVAALLEQTAIRARSRAGYVAAARAFGQAARLSRGSARPRQLVRAARCWQLAGRYGEAAPLLDEARPLATDPSQRALIQHMTAYVRMWRTRLDEVLGFLVNSAEQVEEIDPARAVMMYADAGLPLFMLGQLDHLQRAVRRAYDLGQQVGGAALLAGTVAMASGLTIERKQTAAIRLLRGCEAELAQANPLMRAQDLCLAALTWIWLEGYEEAGRLVDRLITSARRAGALGVLPQALAIASELNFRIGRWADARASATESVRLAEETRQASLYAPFFAARMDAVQGRVEDCKRTTARTSEMIDRLGGECMSVYTGHVLGLLALGQGDTKEAIRQLETVRQLPVAHRIPNPAVVPWAFDLVEAYVRDGRSADAEKLLAEYTPEGDGEPWAQAAAARCRGLLAAPEDMADAFKAAVDAPACATMPFERARTELCMGERLRRARLRSRARLYLGSALETFDRLGAAPWAQRTRAELRAGGETVRRDADDAMQSLTPQELQVALAVGRGATNHEAAAALFLSKKTIEYHLSNIYRKINVRSRAQLAALVG